MPNGFRCPTLCRFWFRSQIGDVRFDGALAKELNKNGHGCDCHARAGENTKVLAPFLLEARVGHLPTLVRVVTVALLRLPTPTQVRNENGEREASFNIMIAENKAILNGAEDELKRGAITEMEFAACEATLARDYLHGWKARSRGNSHSWDGDSPRYPCPLVLQLIRWHLTMHLQIQPRKWPALSFFDVQWRLRLPVPVSPCTRPTSTRAHPRRRAGLSKPPPSSSLSLTAVLSNLHEARWLALPMADKERQIRSTLALRTALRARRQDTTSAERPWVAFIVLLVA